MVFALILSWRILIFLHIINCYVVNAFEYESPCLEVFQYEDSPIGVDGWYGRIKVTTINPRETRVLQLNVVLDREVPNLETNDAKVTTSDRKNFLLTDLSLRNWNNDTNEFDVNMFVRKKKNAVSTPRLQDIKLNGKTICLSIRAKRDVVDEDCGVLRTQARLLITNAKSVKITQYPWHAAIYRYEGVNHAYKCGGSLITKRHVLTAAHCAVATLQNPLVAANASIFIVYLGLENRRKLRGKSVQEFDVLDVKYHKDFNIEDFHNDVAVITLDGEATITEYVRPICLWEADNGLADIVSRTGYVAGWGYDESEKLTDELKHAPLPVVSEADCIRSNPNFFGRFSSTSNYCAGARTGISVCNGDSGGGMVFLKGRSVRKTVWELRGIVSLAALKLGTDVCDINEYVLFTDIVKFLPWIRNLTGATTNKRYTTCGHIEPNPKSLRKNGTDIQSRVNPWQGFLYINNQNANRVVNLISATHAITVAASSMRTDSSSAVDAYVIFKSNYIEVPDQQVKQVDKFGVHPHWDVNNENKIAIVKFSTPIEYTNYVRPVCLWQEHVSLRPLVGKNGRVPSTSQSNEMYDYRVVSSDQCIHEFATANTLCAHTDGLRPCEAPHGAGIVFPISNTDPPVWQLRGMLTESLVYPNRGCYVRNFVFVDVAQALDWIEEFMDE